jgi:hypothetical protein
MGMRPVFVLLLSLLGCAADPSIAPSVTPEPAPVMPPAPSMPPPGPVAAPAEPVGPEPASTPPAVDPPATTCEIHTEYWYSHGPRTLRSESGRAYGTIRHADEMRLTTAGGAAVEFTSLGLRLRMRKHAGDVPVYPRRELVFADVLQAGLGTPLGWSAVEGPRLRVAPPRDRRVRFVSAPALEVDCEALTLESGYSDVVTADRRLRPRAIAGGERRSQVAGLDGATIDPVPERVMT